MLKLFWQGLLIKNGSTMVTDIDLRTYSYTNQVTGASLTSTLVIQVRFIKRKGMNFELYTVV